MRLLPSRAGGCAVDSAREQNEGSCSENPAIYQDHNSYRAEVFAIILAMECFWKIDIFSDCEAVENQSQLTCDGVQRGEVFAWVHMRTCGAKLWII